MDFLLGAYMVVVMEVSDKMNQSIWVTRYHTMFKCEQARELRKQFLLDSKYRVLKEPYCTAEKPEMWVDR